MRTKLPTAVWRKDRQKVWVRKEVGYRDAKPTLFTQYVDGEAAQFERVPVDPALLRLHRHVDRYAAVHSAAGALRPPQKANDHHVQYDWFWVLAGQFIVLNIIKHIWETF